MTQRSKTVKPKFLSWLHVVVVLLAAGFSVSAYSLLPDVVIPAVSSSNKGELTKRFYENPGTLEEGFFRPSSLSDEHALENSIASSDYTVDPKRLKAAAAYLDYRCQDKDKIYLRMYNNTSWNIGVLTDELYYPTKTPIRLLNGVSTYAAPNDKAISLQYRVELRETTRPGTKTPQMTTHDNGFSAWIAPHDSILFSVARAHLGRNLQVIVKFNYEWEITKQGQTLNNAEHSITFNDLDLSEVKTLSCTSNYAAAISLIDENGSPRLAEYRAGDNVWLKVAVTNLSDEAVDVPKGEDYTEPKVLRNGTALPYKKSIVERIRRHESNGSYVARGTWLLKPHQSEYDIVDLGYWYDLQPGYYQVYVERLLPGSQRVQSDSTFFQVLPALAYPNAESAVVIKTATPPYPPIAAAWAVSGTVFVYVEIDPAGFVTAARAESGPALLRKPATDAARFWRFNAVEPARSLRSVRLTFIFRELSYESKKGEQAFTPPYQMAIERVAVPVNTNVSQRKTSKSLLKRTVMLPWLVAQKVF